MLRSKMREQTSHQTITHHTKQKHITPQDETLIVILGGLCDDANKGVWGGGYIDYNLFIVLTFPR